MGEKGIASERVIAQLRAKLEMSELDPLIALSLPLPEPDSPLHSIPAGVRCLASLSLHSQGPQELIKRPIKLIRPPTGTSSGRVWADR